MDFSRRSRATNSVVKGLILSKFILIRVFMVVLVTCKNEEVLIRLHVDFPDTQGQLTQQSVVKSA